LSDLVEAGPENQRIPAFAHLGIPYAFDNVSVCGKDKNSLPHKELAASIQVNS
jgi:hypothetical protein